VWQGDGPPPGYKFTVLIADLAYREARGFLTFDQYEHAASFVKELAEEDDPTRSATQRIEAIDTYHELKDKGGILGKINLRVFFHVDQSRSALIILGAINKANEGQTPKAVRIRMRRRLRKYLNGEWHVPE
jgi:hypothetical protein